MAASFFLHATVPELLHVLFRGRFQRTHDAEAEELRVGVVPDALRELRVLDFPVRVRGAPRGDPEFFSGIIVPCSASGGVWVRFGCLVPGVLVFAGFVETRIVLVESPFDHVAKDVVKTPGVGLFLSHLLVFPAAVLGPPAVFADFRIIISPEELGFRAGARGVFPFGFCWEPIEVPCFCGQPFAVLVGCVLGHGDGGETVLTHPEAHLDVGLSGVRDGVGHFVEIGVELFGGSDAALFGKVHEEFELVPSDLVGAHPEGRDFDLSLRAFIVVPAFFSVGASHEERSAGDGDEIEGDVGAGDALGVGFHLLLGERLGGGGDAFVDGGDEFGFIDGLNLLDFAGDELEVVGPLSALGNPLFDEVGFLFREWATFLFWGHDEVVVCLEYHGGVDEAFVRFSWHEGVAAFTAFESLRFCVHAKAALGIAFAVAPDAVLFKDRLDIFHKVHCCGGWQGRGEGYGESEDALGRFHGDGANDRTELGKLEEGNGAGQIRSQGACWGRGGWIQPFRVTWNVENGAVLVTETHVLCGSICVSALYPVLSVAGAGEGF